MASDSASAEDALQRASARFIGEVGFNPLLMTDDEVTLDGNSTELLLLPAAPVTEVASVTLNGVALAPTGYNLSKRLGMLQRWQGWPWGFGNVVVVYSHGYAQDALPGDISDAVLEQAEAIHRVRAGVASSTLGPQAVTFASGTTEAFAKAVTRYQRGRTLPA